MTSEEKDHDRDQDSHILVDLFLTSVVSKHMLDVVSVDHSATKRLIEGFRGAIPDIDKLVGVGEDSGLLGYSEKCLWRGVVHSIYVAKTHTPMQALRELLEPL